MSNAIKYTAMAYSMPTTISASTDRAKAITNATRKARKSMRNMKASGQLPEIVVRETLPQIVAAGNPVRYDNSGGQGHAWVAATDSNCPAGIVEEIEAEILDGGKDECDDYVASNGCHYRW